MKKGLIIYIVLWAVCAANALGASIAVEGGGAKVIAVDVPASTGLAQVYVVRNATGLKAVYSPDSDGAEVTWWEFGADGAAYSRQIGSGLEIAPEANIGYYAEEGGKRTYIWITDYDSAPFTAGAMSVTEADCSGVTLRFDGSAAPLHYRAINGRLMEIDRDIKLSYFTLTAQEQSFTQSEISRSYSSLGDMITVQAPLCATRFSISGDSFLRQWGEEIVCESESFSPVAVEGIAWAEQTARDVPNEQKSGDTAFGGSAPVEMQFRAAVSDAAVFTEWQLARDADFADITLREQSTEFDYTFSETATSYARFVCANAAGDCEWTSEVLTISVGESRLRCPNAFSPGASEGVNDEWKVSYRSIIEFECFIFNRLGVKMAELHSPDQGWDGRYKGKLVRPGVYYYVIKALGADGKRYNLSGDINIVGSR